MLWLFFLIAAPICIELAGWVVDTTFLVRSQDEPQVRQLDDSQ
jgi:hypothetical protein